MALLNPYLNFRGDAREAVQFYAAVFGGTPDISTFADFQMPGIAEGEADNVMHSQLTTPAGFTLMVSDAPSSMPGDINNGTVSISGDEIEEIRGYWDKLSDGGQVSMPLEQAPWGDFFGQLTDRFGVSWMVNIAGSSAPAQS
ncbi:MAG: VOC family protein [Microlunatus sp.]|nr:VOC family protein [Microlunatus sp.]MDN5770659.1 VOC family protein [Microlunatus sp.]MDN5804528.1 VOC family protein [Microlunatus sp.]